MLQMGFESYLERRVNRSVAGHVRYIDVSVDFFSFLLDKGDDRGSPANVRLYLWMTDNVWYRRNQPRTQRIVRSDTFSLTCKS
jgi:hypothetical protein